MSDHIHELLYRNLREVCGEGDATHRRTAIEELYTEDCVLYVPSGVFVGHDALNKFAGDLRATRPISYTHRAVNLKPSTMPVAWLGVPARAAGLPNIRVGMWSLFATGRFQRSMSSLMPCPRSRVMTSLPLRSRLLMSSNSALGFCGIQTRD